MIHSGAALARRLELAEALNGVACAEAHQRLNPELAAAVLEVGGGFAIFVGPDSPLTHAMGMGMGCPVKAEDLDRAEDFYCARGVALRVELSPLADASLIDLLANRAYCVVEFNNVLVRPMAGTAVNPVEAVRPVYEDEEYLWALTVGRGFLEKDELTPEELDIGRAIWHMPESACYLGFGAGQAGAAASMTMRDGLATLFADGTMTAFRGAGLQGGLIRERLRVAAEAGCDLATASTLPGSTSQRNYERNGFAVAYTKAVLARR